ncbi:MAG TPA: hypothetical protein GXZ90_07450 [Clostridiales bacterium]|nr:hypothetical protein [Clostridiales bacterium]
MKNMTTKQKTIMGIVITAIVLAVLAIVVTKFFDNGFKNIPVEDVLQQKNEFKLTLDYKETPKDKYTVDIDNEKITINTEEIVPNIDTTKIGKTIHSIKIDDENLNIEVTINDSREILLKGDDKFEVNVGMTKTDLENMITEHFTPGEVLIDDELEFQFDYPQDFDLNQENEYENIAIVAKFANNGANRVTKNINISIIAEEVEVAEVDEPVIPNEPVKEPSKPSPEQPSKPTPEKPKPSKPAPVQPKPTPEPSKPTPEKPKPAPVQPEPEKPVETPEFKVPSGIPSGAVLTKEIPEEKFHKFSYNKSLSDGSKITEITTTWPENYSKPHGSIYGTAKNGEEFIIGYTRSGGLSFQFWYQEISQDSMDEIYSVIDSFFNAYGY